MCLSKLALLNSFSPSGESLNLRVTFEYLCFIYLGQKINLKISFPKHAFNEIKYCNYYSTIYSDGVERRKVFPNLLNKYLLCACSKLLADVIECKEQNGKELRPQSSQMGKYADMAAVYGLWENGARWSQRGLIMQCLYVSLSTLQLTLKVIFEVSIVLCFLHLDLVFQ